MSQVAPDSPAFHAGLEKGDFLVSFQDDLVLFMSRQDIEDKMKSLQGLHLHLKIERGHVEPMVNPVEKGPSQKISRNPEDVVTIVLDKERGIYRKKV